MSDRTIDEIDPDSGQPAMSLPQQDTVLPFWDGEYVEAGGVRMHVRRTDPAWSPPGVPTAVYVHGLGGSANNWTDLGAQLAPHAAGVAVDLPGFGFSEPDDGFDFSMSAQADGLAAWLDGSGTGPVHLFGNSMGGAIVALLAARRPDLVRTLTLVSPAVPDLRPDARRLSDPRLALAFLPVIGKPVRRRLAAMSPQKRAQQVVDLCFADPDAVPPPRLEQLAAEHGERMQLTWAAPALARSTMAIVRDWCRWGSGSLWAALRSVQAPTLVIWGTEDKVISARKARRTVEQVPRGKLMLLSNTGHVAQMEHPAAVARAVLDMWRAVGDERW